MREKRLHHLRPPSNLAALLLAVAIFCAGAHAQSGGPLAPPGLPAPTMKSLDEVEARTAIGSIPFTIDELDSYYLTKSFEAADGNGIEITADNVTRALRSGWVSFDVSAKTTLPSKGKAGKIPA